MLPRINHATHKQHFPVLIILMSTNNVAIYKPHYYVNIMLLDVLLLMANDL